VFVAPEGQQFFCADFAAIEDRTGMWYAKEEKMLEAFRNKVDAYCITAEQIYGYPCTKKTHPEERSVGKTTRLGAAYGMGVDTFYEINKEDLKDRDHAKLCIDTYRESTPGIPKAWKEVGYAFVNTLKGKDREWNGCKFRKEIVASRETVTVELPSGRKLFYYEPEIKWEKNEKFGKYVHQLYVKIKVKSSMMYRRTWGGDIFQDINQATARDLCVYGTHVVEGLGFQPVMSVHDEVVCLGGMDRDVKDFEAGFSQKPEWAADIPVDAEGWVGRYYRK